MCVVRVMGCLCVVYRVYVCICGRYWVCLWNVYVWSRYVWVYTG